MKIGDVARIKDLCYSGDYILKNYAGYVDLNDPAKTWDVEPNFEVQILPVGTVITLTVS
jgi:hypothetical protein